MKCRFFLSAPRLRLGYQSHPVPGGGLRTLKRFLIRNGAVAAPVYVVRMGSCDKCVGRQPEKANRRSLTPDQKNRNWRRHSDVVGRRHVWTARWVSSVAFLEMDDCSMPLVYRAAQFLLPARSGQRILCSLFKT